MVIFTGGHAFLTQMLFLSMEVRNAYMKDLGFITSLSWDIRLDHPGSALCVQPCLLALTWKLVCSFGLSLQMTLILPCLMIIRTCHSQIQSCSGMWSCTPSVKALSHPYPWLSAALSSYRSSCHWLTDWAHLAIKNSGKQHLNISAFSISFATSSPPLLKAI